jgi:hypothetical protein
MRVVVRTMKREGLLANAPGFLARREASGTARCLPGKRERAWQESNLRDVPASGWKGSDSVPLKFVRLPNCVQKRSQTFVRSRAGYLAPTLNTGRI